MNVRRRNTTEGFEDKTDSQVLDELEMQNESKIDQNERCSCGATYDSSWPIKLVDIATKQINTWRRFHVCPIRNETTQPIPRQFTPEGER